MIDPSQWLSPFVHVPCELPPAEVETMMPVTRQVEVGGTVLDLPPFTQLQDLRRDEAFLVDDGRDETERAHG